MACIRLLKGGFHAVASGEELVLGHGGAGRELPLQAWVQGWKMDWLPVAELVLNLGVARKNLELQSLAEEIVLDCWVAVKVLVVQTGD